MEKKYLRVSQHWEELIAPTNRKKVMKTPTICDIRKIMSNRTKVT